MGKSNNISISVKDGIGRLLLNRPESRNAISKQMWLDIPQCLSELRSAGAVVIVFEGNGDCFAAGADIMELKDIEDTEAAGSAWSAIASALDFVYNFDLPTVAAVDGPCLGGACLLACACDLRYASHRSSFAIPVARLAIVLDDASLARLSNLLGLARAKELIFRARVLNAEEAYSWGLVNEVFAGPEYAARLLFVLSELVGNSPLTIKESKASFRRIYGINAVGNNEEVVLSSYLSADFRKRIQQVLKKQD